ncbi:E3 ubiquitin-protein ligase UPL1-like isoform X1 [Papaver somniferum]|uniref:E3 ubiquitin-protein ligase UPL1-like isoform X1 n=1 Tax=Papaver somniferum TaxID=3469 RepID=UPI000E6FF154|nr:E3 ubiquitin-protein ligase UPL1-like isoform X1 [Papaver somniferum]
MEFLLFLAASRDYEWIVALLKMFGEGCRGVLESIGNVHREVLWQIALLENEEQTGNPCMQNFDPLLRQRSSGWGVASQLFDLTNVYPDLGCASGGPQRSAINGSSNLWPGCGHALHISGSSVANCQTKTMLGSLSYYISHLFLALSKTMLVPISCRGSYAWESSVAYTIADIVLNHLKFVRQNSSCGSGDSIPTKYVFIGKVIDFVNFILLDIQDCCNAYVLKEFCEQKVVEELLSKFEASSKLCLEVSSAPVSPMHKKNMNANNGQKERTHHSLNDLLVGYGKLMNHLVSRDLVVSSFKKHLVGSKTVVDPQAAVMNLQSMVLEAVLPIWQHPEFSNCSYEFITNVVSIMRHMYLAVKFENVSSSISTGEDPDLVDQLLLIFESLLHVQDYLAFPIRDLLVEMSSQNNGQYRDKVLNFIIERLTPCFG